MAWTDKQLLYLQQAHHRWNIKVGATGSGKSFLDYAAVIPKRLLALRGEGAAVLIGNTRQTFCRNILDPMREIWGQELVGTVRADSTVLLFGVRCHVLGADNKKHVARIQGMTIEYAYGDEITTWSREVFEMLKSRLRCAHSHFDGTCNPDHQNHWFHRFLQTDADLFCQTSTIDDNPFLPPAFVRQLKEEYRGTVYYARYILGEWSAGSGVIYREFADAEHTGSARFLWPKDRALRLMRVHLGVDFGGNGSKHAFVAAGILPGYQGVVVLRSARSDPGTPQQLSREFLDFAGQVLAQYGRIDAVYCDSAEQVLIRGMIQAAKAAGFAALAAAIHNAAKLPINDRIRLVSMLMGGGRFFVQPEAQTAREALSSAVWSEKTPGADERLDDGSTDIDTLDALEYAVERDFKRFIRFG